MLGFFALGEKGSHFASFNKGFGSKTGLLEAHIMAGWGRGSIFIWRAVYVFFFAGRPAGGRVCIFFAAGAVLVFFWRGRLAGAVIVFLFGGRRRVSIFISQIRPARVVLVFFYVLK